MQRLRFINPLAQITDVTVAAVNDGEPLAYNEIYAVSNELADELLKNEGDWRQLTPPDELHKAAQQPVNAAEGEVSHE